ncbi:MAG: choice-of-anchor Q domain-containing protein, partial [Candidatus Binatia bacterium]
GIWNQGAMVVRNSSIVFNTSVFSGSGGGIANSGSLEIISSTVAKNVVTTGLLGGDGAGIANFSGLVSITNSTIRENQVKDGPGGGISNSIGGTVRLQNTIVAGNTSVGLPIFATGPDCSGTITSLGTNLFGDLSDCAVNVQPTDRTGDPGLDALVGAGEEDLPGKAYYPVLAGSVVLNSGNAAACPSTDQLGNPRVGKCDIGAIESQVRLLVSVDLRPRSDANRINPNSTKTVNVAIFSSNGFDATAIDPNTVRYGATGTEAVAIHVARRDVDADGNRDMVLRFQITETGISCGDTSALLTGQIPGGMPVIGSSPIQTVQCPKQKKPKIASRLK